MGKTSDRFLAGIVRAVEGLNERVGRATSWLVLTMVLNTFIVAVLRYGLNVGWVWFQELYVWMHGNIIMVAAGYTLLHDGHVRVDIFYRAAKTRTKAWINLLGVAFFLIPMVTSAAWVTWPYVLLSWQRLETSREAGGMHGLFLLKTTMLIFCALLLLQGVALAVRSFLILRNGNVPESIGGNGKLGD